jgi:phenylpyruvate tautomerase PptA (4-oxalocrotonate tautomerase family)
MPIAIVTTPPLTDETRANLARQLTDAIAAVAEVPPAKVQLFFREQTSGPVSIEILAVQGDASKMTWITAIQTKTHHNYAIHPDLYPPELTARGGVLRTPPTDTERQ